MAEEEEEDHESAGARARREGRPASRGGGATSGDRPGAETTGDRSTGGTPRARGAARGAASRHRRASARNIAADAGRGSTRSRARRSARCDARPRRLATGTASFGRGTGATRFARERASEDRVEDWRVARRVQVQTAVGVLLPPEPTSPRPMRTNLSAGRGRLAVTARSARRGGRSPRPPRQRGARVSFASGSAPVASSRGVGAGPIGHPGRRRLRAGCSSRIPCSRAPPSAWVS